MADEVDDEMISTVMRELGRRGGEAKVPKGFAMLSDEERSAVAKKAAAARWGKGKAKAVKKPKRK